VVDGHRSLAPASHSAAPCSRSDAAKRRRRRTASGAGSCCLRVARTAAASPRPSASRINSSRRWRATVRRSRWIMTLPWSSRVGTLSECVVDEPETSARWLALLSLRPARMRSARGWPAPLPTGSLSRSRIHSWSGGFQPLRLQMAHVLIASMQRLGRFVASLAIRDAQPRQPTECARRCPAW
jgi:hypothetical protein